MQPLVARKYCPLRPPFWNQRWPPYAWAKDHSFPHNFWSSKHGSVIQVVSPMVLGTAHRMGRCVVDDVRHMAAILDCKMAAKENISSALKALACIEYWLTNIKFPVLQGFHLWMGGIQCAPWWPPSGIQYGRYSAYGEDTYVCRNFGSNVANIGA